MKRLVEGKLRREFPLTFGAEMHGEIGRLFDFVLSHQFDNLLPNMLRKQTFVELYMGMFTVLDALSGDALIAALEKIAREDKGVFFFGDAAYLKLANNIGREHGDWMLQLIASYIENAGFGLYGRFREGDEFVSYHVSTEAGLAAVDVMCKELAEFEVGMGLPVAIDFGHAEHREVAEAYLRLLKEGWNPDPGRLPSQVFFDIALKIAEVRAGVHKVYNRALLLFFYYNDFSAGDPEASAEQYETIKDHLTRGGKFVEPKPSWLGMTKQQLGGCVRVETLSLLSPPADASYFDRTVIASAEAMYFIKE